MEEGAIKKGQGVDSSSLLVEVSRNCLLGISAFISLASTWSHGYDLLQRRLGNSLWCPLKNRQSIFMEEREKGYLRWGATNSLYDASQFCCVFVVRH